MNLKKNLCKKLLESGKVKPFDVIDHSYTDSGERDIERSIISTNGILPTITTRPDTMAVVVKENKDEKNKR